MTITVILGPARCQGCEQLVVYGTARLRGASGKVRRWRDPETGRQHRCKGDKMFKHFYRPGIRTGDALAECLDCHETPRTPGFGVRHETSPHNHRLDLRMSDCEACA